MPATTITRSVPILFACLAIASAGLLVSPAHADENQTPIGNHDEAAGVVGPSNCKAAGWAVDPNDRSTRLAIRILADGSQIAAGVADEFRQDLLDAGVSPDGYSSFHINLWGLVSFNVVHVITTQAQDAQSGEWVTLGAPKSLNCAGYVPTPDELENPKLSFFTADCASRGRVHVTAVFFASDNPFGGSTSAFQVIGENTVLIVYTPGTDRHADDTCTFGWTAGWEPKPPWNRTFQAQVFVTSEK